MLIYKKFFQIITQISSKKSLNLIYYNKYYIIINKEKIKNLFLLDNTVSFLHVLIKNLFYKKKKNKKII